MIGARFYWPLRFSRWRAPATAEPGFTLLLPVPGDLPVFLDLALKVCVLQQSPSRAATLVIPDLRTPSIERITERYRSRWSGPLEVVDLPRPERALLPRLKDPGRNHGVQLIAGVQASRTSHIVLHDADLFLLDPGAHEQQYRLAERDGLAALGVSPPWDPWYEQHGLHLAATWELCARVDWLRSVPPHRHLGHDADMFGERHTFDTTFWAQARTPPHRLAVHGLGGGLIHFNYVISAYRAFQRSSGSFRDDRYRLLLIRVLIDLFDEDQAIYDVPSLETLAAGLRDPAARVSYVGAETQVYASFRRQLEGILAGPWSEPGLATRTRAALAPFDEYLSYAS